MDASGHRIQSKLKLKCSMLIQPMQSMYAHNMQPMQPIILYLMHPMQSNM